MRHIHIIGSAYYCHANANNRKRMDPFREKGLLFGYSETSEEYRVYIPTHKRIIVSMDSQFDEDRALRRSIHLRTKQHLT